MAYRFLDPNPVYFDTAGTSLAANGSLTFYNINTTTPKTTYSNQTLTTPNPNPVELDANGRASVDIFLNGNYTVLLKDELGATVWTKNIYDESAAATTIPSLVSGRYLTNDGINLSWGAVRQVPDPSGNANKVLGNDGANLIWVSQTAIPEPDIVNTSTSSTIGDGTTKIKFQAGTATGTNSGGRTQTVNVTFPSAFSTAPVFVTCTLTNAGNLSTAGNNPSQKITSISTTGFTVVWTMGELDDTRAQYDFNAAVSFSYLAIGVVA